MDSILDQRIERDITYFMIEWQHDLPGRDWDSAFQMLYALVQGMGQLGHRTEVGPVIDGGVTITVYSQSLIDSGIHLDLILCEDDTVDLYLWQRGIPVDQVVERVAMIPLLQEKTHG